MAKIWRLIVQSILFGASHCDTENYEVISCNENANDVSRFCTDFPLGPSTGLDDS